MLGFGIYANPQYETVASPSTKALAVRCSATACTNAEVHAIVDQLLTGALVQHQWLSQICFS